MAPSSEGFCIAIVLAGVMLAGIAPTAASTQPVSVCPVCEGDGAVWSDAEWPAPAESDLTVRIHDNGTATWVATPEWRDPSRAPGPDDEAEIEALVRAASVGSRALPPREAVEADVGPNGTATVRWRTSAGVERRFGQAVVTLFHTPGSASELYLNTDRLTVHVPDGTVITNDPAAGSVRANGTELHYFGPGYMDDFYVAYGEDDGLAAALAMGSIVWPRVAAGALVILGPAGLALGAGLLSLRTVGKRREDEPGETMLHVYGALGLGLGSVLVAGLVAAPADVTTPWAPFVAAALFGLVGFGYAVARGRRRLAAAIGMVIYLVLAAPFVARSLPGVDAARFYLTLAAGGMVALTVAVLLAGTPAYLFGDALARRR